MEFSIPPSSLLKKYTQETTAYAFLAYTNPTAATTTSDVFIDKEIMTPHRRSLCQKWDKWAEVAVVDISSRALA